jgi:glucose/arabinose dehydrogenase
VDVARTDVEVHAAGLRNAFGLVATRGKLYATDNG